MPFSMEFFCFYSHIRFFIVFPLNMQIIFGFVENIDRKIRRTSTQVARKSEAVWQITEP